MLRSNRALAGVRFAVRPRVVAKHLGMLLVALALLTLVPAGAAVLAQRFDVAARYGLVILVLLGLGGAGARLRCPSDMQTNEALSVTALVFIVSGLALTYPLQGYDLPLLDALFEAVSGVTTTGLSTLASVETRSPAFLFARAWSQWVGGLGVVVLALALMAHAGPAALRLGGDRRERDDVVGSTRAHARRVVLVYAVLTLLSLAALLAGGLDPLEAIAQAMAAISTGGFATRDASLGGFESLAVRATVLLTCLAGAISFGWYYGGYYHRPLRMLRDERLLALGLAVALATALLLWVEDAPLGPAAVGHALARAVSAQSTAGFSLAPVGDADVQLVLIGSMLVGGEAGSTAGGVKVLRALIFLRLLHLCLLRAAVPRQTHVPLRVARERVTPREIELALAVGCGHLLVISASWLVFLAHDAEPMAALFEVVSATTTTGLSSGLTSADLAPTLKLVLCADMLMGRVETVALLVLLAPRTWLGMRRRST